MKKLAAVLFVVCLLLAAAQAAPIEEIAVGMTREAVKGLIVAQGEDVSFEDDDTLNVISANVYLAVSLDPATGLVDWFNLSMPGLERAPFDLTAPDWSLTLENVMQTLRAGKIGYDLYMGMGNPSVYCTTGFCDGSLVMSMNFDEQTHRLCSVTAELYNNESPMILAVQMACALGTPAPMGDGYIADYASGASHDLVDSVHWMTNGNLYSLQHRTMTYSYLNDSEPDTVWESRLNLTIEPLQQ